LSNDGLSDLIAFDDGNASEQLGNVALVFYERLFEQRIANKAWSLSARKPSCQYFAGRNDRFSSQG
ncbi:MAG TPA: hypothetical protein VHU22_11595, partial [Xanthobacteraceae bacterium]|nr:hypothetical protein [Xanthobacteraceae bacterium]